MDKKQKWIAIVNPSSGNAKTKKQWPIFAKQIQLAGIDLENVYTEYSGHGTVLTREALQSGYHKVIAVGGDGTVNEVLNGLIVEDKPAFEDVTLAIAHGTGSDFRRNIDNKNSIQHLIQSLQSDRYREIDIGKVSYQNERHEEEGRYFINAANVGIGAEVVNGVNSRSKLLGSKFTYLSGTLLTLFQYQNIPLSLNFDQNKTIEGDFCAAMICNGQYIGGGMHIAPEAQIDDGFLDVILVKALTKRRLLSKLPLIYSGRHMHLPEIELHRCRKLVIETPKTAILEADGEILGRRPREFQLLPRCLRLKI